jgi:uncharacterized protein (DUF1697 family)
MRYAVFLRGVNVGAHNRLKMADFKRMLEELGLERVETYIQSGNAVFDSDEGEAALAQKIVAALAASGVQSSVVLRTAEQMRAMVDALPFSEAEIAAAASDEWESLYVVLFSAAPDTIIASDAKDRAALVGREVYFLLGQSIRLSKLAAKLVKQETATARNWNTILKVKEMAEK